MLKFNFFVRVLIHLCAEARERKKEREAAKKLQNKVETFASLAKIPKLAAEKEREAQREGEGEGEGVGGGQPQAEKRPERYSIELKCIRVAMTLTLPKRKEPKADRNSRQRDREGAWRGDGYTEIQDTPERRRLKLWQKLL